MIWHQRDAQRPLTRLIPRMSQFTVSIFNSAANDKATAEDLKLSIVHGNELFMKTENVLHLVLSHSIASVVLTVHHRGDGEDQNHKK